MKVLLAALNAKYVHSNLAIRYIKEYSSIYDIELFETSINDNLMETAINIIDKKPDLIGFSTYIWNVEATIKVCSIIKEVLPGTSILLGGPEVSFNGREYLENYCFIDYVIMGEGEYIFRNLLDEISYGSNNLHNINGLIFRENMKVVENNPSTPICNLDEIPFPYEKGIPNKILYYEASRGCPFNCTYCLSSAGKGVRFFSIDRVIKDLKILIENGVELVKFVDRTFNANKKLALEIWDFLIDNHGKTKFHFEIAADLLDDDMLEILKKAPKNVFQFEIGVQTTNPKILRNINRVMDFNKVKSNIMTIKNYDNIHCHIDLIAGLPGENIDSFINSFDMCMDIKPDVLQLGFLKILKGSPIYKEIEKYGIHYINHPNYHVLYTDDMSYENIRKLLRFEKVFETYYNSGIFNLTISYILSFVESKFDFFNKYTDYLMGKDFFNRNLDLKDKFKLLFDFGSLYCDENIIKDIMIHDFVINTKKSVLPEFLKKEDCKIDKKIMIENKCKLENYFGQYDAKRLFSIPVEINIIKHSNDNVIKKCSSMVVFDMLSGRYCYIQR